MTVHPTAPHRFDARRPLCSYLDALAERHPDASAILIDDDRVTYADLMHRARLVAAGLAARGVGQGDLVGLYFTRSVDLLVAMLGALRANAVCVPLDPSYASPEQLRQIVRQTSLAMVISAADDMAEALALTHGAVPSADVATLEQSQGAVPPLRVTGADAACMVFTSGTTGAPKGVVLPHRGLAAFALDQREIALRSDDIMMHASSMACDAGLIEVWPALLNGAALAMAAGAKASLQQMADVMRAQRVTVTCQYVGMHNLLVDHHADAFATVRLAMAGGDVMSPDHIRRLRAAVPGLSMVNIYGPSETTCISLVQDVTDDLLTGAPIPIGRPLSHECAFVLDEDLRLAPDGQKGQLAIGGSGVALGYHGLPDKTDAVFIDDPRPGQTGNVDLTGDLALRRSEDGVVD